MKIYLFDFDGTLVDSMPTYSGIMRQILEDNNIEYTNKLMKIITPLGFKGSAKYFINVLGVDSTEEDLIQLMNEKAIYEYSYNILAKHNVIEVLEKLKKNGAQLNILTASPHITLDPCLKRLGIYDLFTNIWSCEDFATTKDDPDIYIKASEKIGVGVEEVIFLDDNYNALLTAKRAGMQVCGVYDKSSDEYVDEIEAIADRYIYDFTELLMFFEIGK